MKLWRGIALLHPIKALHPSDVKKRRAPHHGLQVHGQQQDILAMSSVLSGYASRSITKYFSQHIGGARMIREVATITVKDGQTEAFRQGFEKAKPLFLAAKGCKGAWLEQCVEKPNVINLNILWETLEDHTVTFRESEDFLKWRSLVSDSFAEPPQVLHFEAGGAD